MTSRFGHSWMETDLSELIDIIESGLRPYGGVTEDSGEIPSLGGENIRQQGGLDFTVVKKVPREFFNLLRKGILQREDVLINKDGANTGKVAIYQSEFSDACINEHLFLLRGKSDRLDQRFLYSLLRSHRAQATIRRKISGSAQPGLKSDFIRRFQVEIPSSPSEQRRIAEVLDLVDEMIAKTEAVIAKLRQVRTGMLHDLLTRGLDENGELRDPRLNPNQFKDSPLGKIPNSWEVKEIKDCYLVPSRNGLYKKVSSYGFGHRMIHMPQMFKSAIVEPNEAVRVDVTPEELQRYALEEGDLLFARRSLNLEGAGLCSIVPELKEPVTFESSIIRVRLDRRKILSHFAVEFLRSPKGYLLRRPFIRQVAVSGVSSEDVGQFLLPCPEPSEQERILSVLEIYDQALSLFEKKLVKLNSIKEGLMSDLLSGRVRMPEGII